MGRDLHSFKVELHILVGAKIKHNLIFCQRTKVIKGKAKKWRISREDEINGVARGPITIPPSLILPCTTTTIKIMLYSSYTYYQCQSFSFSLSAGLVGAVNTKICSN
ncbi:hypothetical protein L2E82_21863 [Cichorium intybus]|uniref:Uncharacterized protein n=1 Tax=Cichorium intybus TaxID=13427 RepID=A0ACB9DWK0_CICIN|nr:hypothetical protein L2E82_21863 [Cichorium intybus]